MNNQQILETAIQKAIDVYDIQTNGYIERKDNGRPILGSVNRTGYRYISVYLSEFKKSKKINVHKLVALKYIPNPDNLPQINHIDGNRLNNQIDNLEWCTAQYNVSDGFKRGRIVWNKGNVSKERILYYAKRYPRQLLWFLTTDNFAVAKALWEDVDFDPTDTDLWEGDGYTSASFLGEAWQFHIQNMVIADDPIEYLGENL